MLAQRLPAPVRCARSGVARPLLALPRQPRSGRSTRPAAPAAAAAAASATTGHVAAAVQLPNFWAALLSEQLRASGVLHNARHIWLVSHCTGNLLIPFLEACLIIWLTHRLARMAHAWVEANPDRPVMTEVVGMLPAALETPAVVTVCTIMATRLLRNAIYLTDTYLHTFERHSYSLAADHLLDHLCSLLVPLDSALIKFYSCVTLLFVCSVLVRWKSLGLAFLLRQERERRAAALRKAGLSAGPPGTTRSSEDLERMILPLDAVTSWLIWIVAGISCAHVAGCNIAPLLAVGGVGSVFLGLATQQLLTNSFMGLLLVATRPFVDGDSVQLQGGGLLLSGVVERTTIMRTTLRSDDDTLVSIPNKTVTDMVVWNRSAKIKRSPLALANRQAEPLKLRLKVPPAAEGRLGELQAAVLGVLDPPADVRAGLTAAGPHPVVPGSAEVVLNRFTDAGLELLVKGQLRSDPADASVRALLLQLSGAVRPLGATLVTI